MRHQGQIDTWQDDRGFGFITPAAGGRRVFVHIKSFQKRGRRPAVGDTVTYLHQRDQQGRLQAARVAYADTAAGHGVALDKLLAVGLALAALGGVSAAAVMGQLPFWILLLYAGASSITFLAYAVDKSAARRGRWRMSENTLHLFSLVGGWPGALVAQRWLRHKSRKTSFQLAYWATVTLNCAALAWLYLHPEAVL